MTDASPLRADAHRNRATVLAAAVELLSRVPDASMKDVAEASGLGRTTVYRHFPSREALTKALFEQAVDSTVEELREIVAASREPRAVLRGIATATVRIGGQYLFLAAHRDQLVDVQRARQDDDPLREWILDGQADGSLRPLGLAWMQEMLGALVIAAHDQVLAGEETVDSAADKLAETLIGAFVA
ncbi:MAG: helix-turn-helix domain-containing protein [Solirubrobacteraceae bacterium]|nr:helix-turn-helix domain-containing protein [Solirubrobacteraceae bacterium]